MRGRTPHAFHLVRAAHGILALAPRVQGATTQCCTANKVSESFSLGIDLGDGMLEHIPGRHLLDVVFTAMGQHAPTPQGKETQTTRAYSRRTYERSDWLPPPSWLVLHQWSFQRHLMPWPNCQRKRPKGYGHAGIRRDGTAMNGRSPHIRTGQTFAGDSVARKFWSMGMSVSLPTGWHIIDRNATLRERHQRPCESSWNVSFTTQVKHCWMSRRWEQLVVWGKTQLSRSLSGLVL